MSEQLITIENCSKKNIYLCRENIVQCADVCTYVCL